MPFWTYTQNNSGGSFDITERIKPYVIIEAKSDSQADSNAEAIGLYFDGDRDCPCCGERWRSAYGNGDATPMHYSDPIIAWVPDCFEASADTVVYYLDGSKRYALTPGFTYGDDNAPDMRAYFVEGDGLRNQGMTQELIEYLVETYGFVPDTDKYDRKILRAPVILPAVGSEEIMEADWEIVTGETAPLFEEAL